MTTVDSGDSVIVTRGKEEYRVQLVGIDAPEPGQPRYEYAVTYLASLAKDKFVRVETTGPTIEGSVSGTIWVQPRDCGDCGETLNVNHALLVAGWAWWDKEQASRLSMEDSGRYASAEAEARARKRGLWQDETPIAPWDWRKGIR